VKKGGERMQQKHFGLLVLTALVAGFLGGFASNQMSAVHPAFAQKKPKVQNLVVAREFRLVDKNGQTVALLQSPVEGSASLILNNITKKDHSFGELNPEGFNFVNPERRSSFSYISEALRIAKGDSTIQLSFREQEKPYVALIEKEKIVWAAPQK
jgi:hypothetical protein